MFDEKYHKPSELMASNLKLRIKKGLNMFFNNTLIFLKHQKCNQVVSFVLKFMTYFFKTCYNICIQFSFLLLILCCFLGWDFTMSFMHAMNSGRIIVRLADIPEIRDIVRNTANQAYIEGTQRAFICETKDNIINPEMLQNSWIKDNILGFDWSAHYEFQFVYNHMKSQPFLLFQNIKNNDNFNQNKINLNQPNIANVTINHENHIQINRFQKINRQIVDIGAYDGIFGSNSLNFINLGWNAVLVEPVVCTVHFSIHLYVCNLLFVCFFVPFVCKNTSHPFILSTPNFWSTLSKKTTSFFDNCKHSFLGVAQIAGLTGNSKLAFCMCMFDFAKNKNQ